MPKKFLRAAYLVALLAWYLVAGALAPQSSYGAPTPPPTPALPECPPKPRTPNTPWPPYPCRRSKAASYPRPSANVCLRLSTNVDATDRAVKQVTYQVTAQNRGHRTIKGARITLPLYQGANKITNVSLPNAETWVSAVSEQQIELGIQQLREDQTITVSLRLNADATSLPAAPTPVRAQMTWTIGQTIPTLSNISTLDLSGATNSQIPQLLIVEAQPGERDQSLTVRSSGFASQEIVSLWYTPQGGRAVALGNLQADDSGNLSYKLSLKKLNIARGEYTLDAYGNCSHLTARGIFAVPL